MSNKPFKVSSIARHTLLKDPKNYIDVQELATGVLNNPDLAMRLSKQQVHNMVNSAKSLDRNKFQLEHYTRILDETTHSVVRQALSVIMVHEELRKIIQHVQMMTRGTFINPNNIVLPPGVASQIRNTYNGHYHTVELNDDNTIKDADFYMMMMEGSNKFRTDLRKKGIYGRVMAEINNWNKGINITDPATLQADVKHLVDRGWILAGKRVEDFAWSKVTARLQHLTTIMGLIGYCEYQGKRKDLGLTEEQLEQRIINSTTGKTVKKFVKDPAQPIVLKPENIAKVSNAVENENARNSAAFVKGWRKIRYEVMALNGNYCAACGVKPGQPYPDEPKRQAIMTGDHVASFKKFTNSRLEILNCQILCDCCNSYKGHKDETDFRTMEQFQIIAVAYYGYKPTTQLQRDIMFNHIGRKLTIQETAKRCGCSPSYARQVISRTKYVRDTDAALTGA